MSRTDYLLCRTLVMDTGQPAPEDGVLFYKAAGFADDMLDVYRKRFGGFGSGVSRLPQSYRRLQDGQELVIGKHTLAHRRRPRPRARTRVPVVSRTQADDLGRPNPAAHFIEHQRLPDRTRGRSARMNGWKSCKHLRALIPDHTLILPSHNEPFYGVKTRMTQLIDGHEEGLAKIVELCATPKRAVDVFPALFRTKITGGNYGMATGESLAHLNCLIARGQIKRTRDADGVDWYKQPRCAQEAAAMFSDDYPRTWSDMSFEFKGMCFYHIAMMAMMLLARSYVRADVHRPAICSRRSASSIRRLRTNGTGEVHVARVAAQSDDRVIQLLLVRGRRWSLQTKVLA